MMTQDQYPRDLISFLEASPTAFHATAGVGDLLAARGFVRLSEREDWGALGPGAYYVTRGESSLIAFILPRGAAACRSLRMAGAHTDSPALKLKPRTAHASNGYARLGVEIYGGAQLASWFDRDCSLAGRVLWRDGAGRAKSGLVDFRRPLAVVPSLAAHLDPEAKKGREINPQTDMIPICGLCGPEGEAPDFAALLLEQLARQRGEETLGEAEILDFDLFLYDAQPPDLLGLDEEFICSARLDNLLSCHAIVQALASCGRGREALIALFDHEEVGSLSAAGARGSFLPDTLHRLFGPEVPRIMARSLFVSADNAHALHPNFAAKHDPEHAPKMRGGPVIKMNAGQRYATSAATAALFALLCREAGAPCQRFVMRNDLACGSTIGPTVAAALGAPVVDVGVPQLAMHSVRETAAWLDGLHLLRVLRTFFDADDNMITTGE